MNTKKSSVSNVKGSKEPYISTYALIMMNVAIIATLQNDAQQAFFGLSSVTFYAIGAIIFFVPTALVAAELAGGWSERGGIFRWVGEGMGKGWGFMCLLILWFQTTFTLGSSMPSLAVTIGFFTPNYKWAIKFAENPTHELLIMSGFLAIFWLITWLSTKGAKMFAGISKYGVTAGTIIPVITIAILIIVWLLKGNTPAISMKPHDLIPKWNGMGTLALAAGIFFAYAGIDENAAYIKKLKDPKSQFPLSMLLAGVICFLVFVIGTLIIAMIIPEDKINIIYALYSIYYELGSTIGMPLLYMVFFYLGFLATLAMWITNVVGSSLMLGQVGRSGFLPKKLQSNNSHGMPHRMLYIQALGVTAVAFIVKLLPNVEGFFVMISQTVTIIYMFYYILMFISFLRLRYNQPNRPRTFKVPGGNIGAWLVALIGLGACVFGIALSFYPPTQIKKEVGSSVIYVGTILALIIFILLVTFFIYQLSKRRDWVDKDNDFAPLTWEIEGFKKPQKVLSNIPSAILSEGQNPMGMPIRKPFNPSETLEEFNKQSLVDKTLDSSNEEKQRDVTTKRDNSN